MEPEDEWPHQPGSEHGWVEWWFFDFAAADGEAVGQVAQAALEGCIRLCLVPHQGIARYWASLLGADREPVVVHDDDVPLPRRGVLEIRSEGLWADHVIEAPFEQVGVGCEAFGLRLGSLEDLERTPVVGDRIPFGLDLEWGTLFDASAQPIGGDDRPAGEPALAGASSRPPAEPAAGYRIDCEVYGEVLVADERIQITGRGSRTHAWGTHPLPFVPRLDARHSR